MINKIELYSIADIYKAFSVSDILLIHNYKILKKDNSLINEIHNDDTIIIIEERYYPDDSYYISLQKKYDNNYFESESYKKISEIMNNGTKIICESKLSNLTRHIGKQIYGKSLINGKIKTLPF